MKLLQLTDIHLTTPGQTIAGRNPNTNFAKALNHAVEHHPDAEAVFITGDLSDWGEKADYELLRRHVERCPLPVHLCIGNHDDRPAFLEVFPELADEDGHVQQVIALSAGDAIVIDTWGPESHAGHYDSARLAWLHNRLAEAGRPVFLFMHHNPAPTHIPPMDKIMLLDADAFGDVVAAHREKIAHIFHGHCHLPLSGSFRGIPTSAPRGTNHAGWPNYREVTFLSNSDLPESYAVIFADHGSVTVQMVEFGYDGAVRVEGSPDYADWDRATMAR
ncbi:MAG TPA: phosphodiesterase [Kiloniellaceae bacterium]|nr:phosphodiesterase [Kiloniellaceae bacterium]